MSKGPDENIFSKAIGDLRVEKEEFLQQKARALADAEKEKAAKKAEEKALYDKWLTESEEILVQDCLEAIGEITGGDFATKRSGTISFTSEAFLWFIERLYPNPLARPMLVKDLSLNQLYHYAPSGYKLHYNGPYRFREDIDRKIQIELEKEGRIVWNDKNIRRIFNRTRNKLKTEKFDLTTKDGIEFILHWNSTK